MPEENRYRIDAVWTAAQILREVANSPEPMGMKEVAAILGISENTAYRQCETLAEAGLLERVGAHYGLGTLCMLFWAKSVARLESQREQISRLLTAVRKP
ncbi:MAG: helix-turn-helix domain-containing protein [Syntrophobacterales bacterium]|jgi:DNA-binding IclR family transcriptional regulator|nr:helix-turn-helix domain-containing protein [Syntrophobacterales bacterium]